MTDDTRTVTVDHLTHLAKTLNYSSSVWWVFSEAPSVVRGIARWRKIARRHFLRDHHGQPPKGRRTTRSKRLL